MGARIAGALDGGLDFTRGHLTMSVHGRPKLTKRAKCGISCVHLEDLSAKKNMCL